MSNYIEFGKDAVVRVDSNGKLIDRSGNGVTTDNALAIEGKKLYSTIDASTGEFNNDGIFDIDDNGNLVSILGKVISSGQNIPSPWGDIALSVGGHSKDVYNMDDIDYININVGGGISWTVYY